MGLISIEFVHTYLPMSVLVDMGHGYSPTRAISSISIKVRQGNSDKNFELLGPLHPTNGQHMMTML